LPSPVQLGRPAGRSIRHSPLAFVHQNSKGYRYDGSCMPQCCIDTCTGRIGGTAREREGGRQASWGAVMDARPHLHAPIFRRFCCPGSPPAGLGMGVGAGRWELAPDARADPSRFIKSRRVHGRSCARCASLAWATVPRPSYHIICSDLIYEARGVSAPLPLSSPISFLLSSPCGDFIDDFGILSPYSKLMVQ
jgi:hypothetical protein